MLVATEVSNAAEVDDDNVYVPLFVVPHNSSGWNIWIWTIPSISVIKSRR